MFKHLCLSYQIPHYFTLINGKEKIQGYIQLILEVSGLHYGTIAVLFLKINSHLELRPYIPYKKLETTSNKYDNRNPQILRLLLSIK